MKHLLLFALVILISSQARSQHEDLIYYSPSTSASVGLDDKNDFKINRNLLFPQLGKDVERDGGNFELNASWSPINHIGIYVNRHNHNEISSESFTQ